MWVVVCCLCVFVCLVVACMIVRCSLFVVCCLLRVIARCWLLVVVYGLLFVGWYSLIVVC